MKLGRPYMFVAFLVSPYFFILPVFQMEDFHQKTKGISESITYGELVVLDFSF
jgi:uncharacterized membrane protein YgaE (UPF0421/DUF939 family)